MSQFKDKREAQLWIAELIETLANDGHEVVNAKILQLGRTDLQMVFAALFGMHLRSLLRETQLNNQVEPREIIDDNRTQESVGE